MRHNQNANRQGGRGGNRGRYNNGGNGGGGHHSNGQNGGGNRRINPRVQTFDSNGPEVRIRGTAFQIHEKYVTLARDATSAGDRVLAESYLQHAEHYQRFINEATEEFNQYQQQHQQQYNVNQPQPSISGDANGEGGPVDTGLNDLDQGFLVGPRHGGSQQPVNGGAEVITPVKIEIQQAAVIEGEMPSEAAPARAPRARRPAPNRRGDTEAV